MIAAVAAVLICALTAAGAWSYAQALTAPGYASWTSRTVGWFRDHGAAPLVNTMENWYYSRHTPSTRLPGAGALPATGARIAGSARTDVVRLPALPNLSHLPGEAQWSPGRVGRDGRPAAFHTFFQPDPAHASIVVGVALLRQSDVALHLGPGTRQPSGTRVTDARVPPAQVPRLVATFNSGFKLHDTPGGFYLDGRTGKQLADGGAALVIDSTGHLRVGAWGSDLSMTPTAAAVRQNLRLIVRDGRPVPGLDSNLHDAWGAAGSQFQYTWRSALGTTGTGDVVYVAGDHLNLHTLAWALVQAGAITGMPLDIHPGMVHYAWWTRPEGTARAHKLLPDMTGSAYRYLAADQRDFLYATLR